MHRCDACGCGDENNCERCQRESRLKKEHAREQRDEQGGYDERD